MGVVGSGRNVLGGGDPYHLLRHLEPGLLVDIGAAAGHITGTMLRASPQSRVVAYEPFSGNHGHFNAFIGDDERVELRRRAVGDRQTTSQLFVSSTVAGGGTGLQALAGYSSHGKLVDSAPDLDRRYVEVQVTTLDADVNEHVRFCKVDVQGGEGGVIRGAGGLLGGAMIDVLYVEFDASDPEPLALLDAFGYRLIDGRYTLLSRLTTPDPAFWDIESTSMLSTGESTLTGYPRIGALELSRYHDWMHRQREVIGPLWCDMLAVSPTFIDAFERAARSLRETQSDER